MIALTTKNVPQGLALDGVDVPNLLRRLGPYKCGFLRQPAPTAPLQQRTFTMTELGRHIYPEIGLYTAIDGGVYDLKRKPSALTLYHVSLLTVKQSISTRTPAAPRSSASTQAVTPPASSKTPTRTGQPPSRSTAHSESGASSRNGPATTKTSTTTKSPC